MHDVEPASSSCKSGKVLFLGSWGEQLLQHIPANPKRLRYPDQKCLHSVSRKRNFYLLAKGTKNLLCGYQDSAEEPRLKICPYLQPGELLELSDKDMEEHSRISIPRGNLPIPALLFHRHFSAFRAPNPCALKPFLSQSRVVLH